MIIGITIAGPTGRKPHLGLSEGRVIGGDSQVAEHDEFAAAAEHMALHRRDDRLAHQPGRHLEFQLRMEMCVRLGRVGTPIIRAGFFGADIITGAEAAPIGAQQHNAGRRIRLRHGEGLGQRILQLSANRIQLVGPIERDDADFLIDLVKNDIVRHLRPP